MSFNQTLNQIANGNLSQIYYLGGEESYLLNKAEKTIIKAVLKNDEEASSLTVFYGDPDLRELIAAIETIPFFGDKNMIIVRETALFKASRKQDPDTSELEDRDRLKNSPLERLISLFGNMPPYSYILFISWEKPDKRRKIYKALEKYGATIEALPLKGRELRDWLLEKLTELNIKMNPEAKEHLLTAVNMMPQVSLDFLNSELEKIALYTQNSSQVAPLTLPKLREILSKVPEISIFAMIEALKQKELALALELFQEQLITGKHPVQILALLSRQINQLLQIKELLGKGYDSKQIALHFKLPPFIGEKLSRQSQNFSVDALSQAIIKMANADYLLKSGRSGPYALEEVMIDLCRK